MNSKGFAFGIVLLIATILMFSVIGLLDSLHLSHALIDGDKIRQQLIYASRSGVEWALAKLNTGSSITSVRKGFPDSSSPIVLTIVVTGNSSRKTVTSTASVTVNGEQRNFTMVVEAYKTQEGYWIPWREEE